MATCWESRKFTMAVARKASYQLNIGRLFALFALIVVAGFFFPVTEVPDNFADTDSGRSSQLSSSNKTSSSSSSNSIPRAFGSEAELPTLKLVVLTMNRHASLSRLLASLQKTQIPEPPLYKIVLEFHVDVDAKTGEADATTMGVCHARNHFLSMLGLELALAHFTSRHPHTTVR